MEDPQIDRTKDHLLIDILVVALCAMLCGGEGVVDLEEFGNAKIEFPRSFLDLPKGIPSHATFRRVFAMLDPVQFAEGFRHWTESLRKTIRAEIVAIDGKTRRRSYDRETLSFIITAFTSFLTTFHSEPAAPPTDNSEQKVLDKWVGSWRAIYKLPQSEWIPEEKSGTAELTTSRVIGGRFVQEKAEHSDKTSSSLILTYAAQKNAYRSGGFLLPDLLWKVQGTGTRSRRRGLGQRAKTATRQRRMVRVGLGQRWQDCFPNGGQKRPRQGAEK